MPTTVLDSAFFRDQFGTAAMRAVFADTAQLARCVEVEVALAKVQGALGIIPADATAHIASQCDASKLDLDALRAETDLVGYPVLPLVHQLAKQCGDAGRYLHWGATTQDIMDTALVLQLRDAFVLIESDITALRGIVSDLARKHRDTPMAGRTHLQHALPITFGYKAAVWLSMLDRHAQRLQQLKPRVLVGQFGGAVGTLASLGTRGLAVRAALCAELKLGEPPTTWHVARDGLAEAVNFLALLTGSLGKIAYDVMLLASTEIGEVAEPFVPGRGGSSTMPQKRNPISSELILAAGKAVRQHAGLMLDAMVQDLERATGPWHAEWIALPESFVLTSGALHQAKFMLGGLQVDTARMRKNLDLTGGLIVAEAVMMGLAPHLGRQSAHDVVYGACRAVAEQGGSLADALAKTSAVAQVLDRDAIARLTDPMNYLGMAREMVDAAVVASERVAR
ncbi:MAG: 3-carboxy-cis,cis-muconate cycloisomerase [Burkholderiaceae bacterium]